MLPDFEQTLQNMEVMVPDTESYYVKSTLEVITEGKKVTTAFRVIVRVTRVTTNGKNAALR